MKRTLVPLLVAGLVGSSALSACYVNPRPRVGVAYVMRQPPAERVEVISTRPGVEYVWVAGHWGWRRDNYEWISGRWVIPERGFHEWVPGRWERDRGGWFYVEGRWR
jgi:hypothetical protein